MSSAQIKKSQKITFLALTSGVFILLASIGYFLFQDDSTLPAQTRHVDLPMDKVNPQEIWMTRLEDENKIVEQQLKYLEHLMLDNEKREEEKIRENDQLRKEIARLKKDLQEISEKKEDRLPIHELPVKNDMADPFFKGNEQSIPIQKPALMEVVIEETKHKIHHVDRVIPSGTTVKAVLVSSVDATCGVYSSSDPQPVKLRILDDGHLPKGVEARLKGGIIIASVYGELSSERVFMRLERLTQVKETGEFIETNVTGFVTGEDGKYGVRGSVVDKSAKMIGNAALSGFFSGLSEYLQAKASANTIEYNSNKVPFGTDIAVQGGVQGTCSAFDMLTDYFIKRAEQISPVIQITAGRIVDITFTHSAELGDLYTREKVKEIREISRG